MDDPLIPLSKVIELLLKAERKGESVSIDSLIVDLLREFKVRPPSTPQKTTVFHGPILKLVS